MKKLITYNDVAELKSKVDTLSELYDSALIKLNRMAADMENIHGHISALSDTIKDVRDNVRSEHSPVENQPTSDVKDYRRI